MGVSAVSLQQQNNQHLSLQRQPTQKQTVTKESAKPTVVITAAVYLVDGPCTVRVVTRYFRLETFVRIEKSRLYVRFELNGLKP